MKHKKRKIGVFTIFLAVGVVVVAADVYKRQCWRRPERMRELLPGTSSSTGWMRRAWDSWMNLSM